MLLGKDPRILDCFLLGFALDGSSKPSQLATLTGHEKKTVAWPVGYLEGVLDDVEGH
jgi:hypothetical protein